jgi:hypothetical protein
VQVIHRVGTAKNMRPRWPDSADTGLLRHQSFRSLTYEEQEAPAGETNAPHFKFFPYNMVPGPADGFGHYRGDRA